MILSESILLHSVALYECKPWSHPKERTQIEHVWEEKLLSIFGHKREKPRRKRKT
jgi:hypothetical protein